MLASLTVLRLTLSPRAQVDDERRTRLMALLPLATHMHIIAFGYAYGPTDFLFQKIYRRMMIAMEDYWYQGVLWRREEGNLNIF